MKQIQQIPDKLLLTAEDLQDIMSCSRATAYKLLDRSDLPVIVIGRRKYIHTDLFQEWLRNQVNIHSNAEQMSIDKTNNGGKYE